MLLASPVIPGLLWPITFSTKLTVSLIKLISKRIKEIFIFQGYILSIYKFKLEQFLMRYSHWQQLFILLHMIFSILVMRLKRTNISLYHMIDYIHSEGQSLNQYRLACSFGLPSGILNLLFLLCPRKKSKRVQENDCQIHSRFGVNWFNFPLSGVGKLLS